MDLSPDLFNDIHQDGAPSPDVSSAEAADVMQCNDTAIEALSETNQQLESLNDNVSLLIDHLSSTIDAIARLVKDMRFGMTPEMKTALTEQSKLIAKSMVSNIKIRLEHTTQEISATIADSTAEAKADIARVIRAETEQTSKLLRRSRASICLPQCAVYILAILLFFSLSLNIVLTAFNILIWNNSTVNNLLVIFLITSIGIMAIIPHISDGSTNGNKPAIPGGCSVAPLLSKHKWESLNHRSHLAHRQLTTNSNTINMWIVFNTPPLITKQLNSIEGGHRNDAPSIRYYRMSTYKLCLL